MGSDATVYVVGGPADLPAWARARIDRLEGLWSRFQPASELSRLNRETGIPRTVAPETFELIRRGVEAWRMTAGLFDPTVLGDVLRAGYTTSFDELPAGPHPAGASGLARGAGSIELDPRTRTVRLPAGIGFDPGGIGKGLAADLVVAELLAAGAAGACINLGGDVRAAGTAPEDSWAIAIEHPFRPEPLAVVQLADGAVATSSRLRRCWSTDHGVAHHLIDPRRDTPSAATLAAATAVTARGWQAEAFAKAAFLAGPTGLGVLQRLGVAAALVDEDGSVATNEILHQFLDPARDPALAGVTT